MDDCLKVLEPEQQIAQAVTTYRSAAGMTVKQLAEATGLAPADIIRLEDGTADPTLSTLKQLAAGMGMRLRLEFVPVVERDAAHIVSPGSGINPSAEGKQEKEA